MSLVETAIERAKKLHRARAESAEVRGEGDTASPEEAVGAQAERGNEETGLWQPTHFLELQRVSLDPESCEKFKVLTGEADKLTAAATACYRVLRSRLAKKARNEKWSRIAITSPGPGEGKTVLSLNLAIAVAREKRRLVYLLDLDMRRPALCERVGVAPPRQLSSFFTETLKPDEVLFATDVENLIIGGCTQTVPNASELLASSRLDQLLAHIQRRSPNALILLDLPPVLVTDEALVVAPRVNATYLVVSEGITRREAVTRAVEHADEYKLAGIILNRASEQVGDGYYGY